MLSLCACVCVRVFDTVCALWFVYLRVFVFVCERVCTCESACVHVCVCLSVRVNMSVCVLHVCMHVYARVRVMAHTHDGAHA